MRAKNKLRSIPQAKGVFIDEDLTVLHARVVRELHHQGWSVKTHDGKITAEKSGETTLWLDYPDDFKRLPWDSDKFKELGIDTNF